MLEETLGAEGLLNELIAYMDYEDREKAFEYIDNCQELNIFNEIEDEETRANIFDNESSIISNADYVELVKEWETEPDVHWSLYSTNLIMLLTYFDFLSIEDYKELIEKDHVKLYHIISDDGKNLGYCFYKEKE